MKSDLKLLGSILLALVLTMGTAPLLGCETDGPLENAGEEIDHAIDDVEDELD